MQAVAGSTGAAPAGSAQEVLAGLRRQKRREHEASFFFHDPVFGCAAGN